MRKALTKNDMVYGYLNVEYIIDIKGRKSRECQVLLSTGDKLKVLSSQATTQRNWYLGLSLLKDFESGKGESKDEQQIMESVLSLCRSLKEMAKRLERIEEHIAEAEIAYHCDKQ